MARGDHLVLRRFLYSHHAIDLGDGNVVEYGGKLFGKPYVRQISLAEAADGSIPEVVEYPPESCFSPEEVIQRALSRLGETRYCAWENNCEHFARWCKTGQSVSEQSDTAKGVMALGLVTAGTVAIASSFEQPKPRRPSRRRR
jgi:hypothetical protein